jgi:hypothetical protein
MIPLAASNKPTTIATTIAHRFTVRRVGQIRMILTLVTANGTPSKPEA